jgi:hypothetical protein
MLVMVQGLVNAYPLFIHLMDAQYLEVQVM